MPSYKCSGHQFNSVVAHFFVLVWHISDQTRLGSSLCLTSANGIVAKMLCGDKQGGRDV